MTPLDLSWYDLGALIVGPAVFMVGIGITIYLARKFNNRDNYFGKEDVWMAATFGPVCSIAVALLAALIWPLLLAAAVLSIVPIKLMNFRISELFEKEKVSQ